MPSQLFASGVFLPSFHLDTSGGRPKWAGGGVVVRKSPVLTSAQVIWFVFVAGLAVLLFASGLASISRKHSCNSWNSSHFSDKPLVLASGIGLQTSGKDSLPTGAWRLRERARNRATRTSFIDLHETPCLAGFCTTPAIHPEAAIRQRNERNATHLISKTSGAIIPPSNGKPSR